MSAHLSELESGLPVGHVATGLSDLTQNAVSVTFNSESGELEESK